MYSRTERLNLRSALRVAFLSLAFLALASCDNPGPRPVPQGSKPEARVPSSKPQPTSARATTPEKPMPTEPPQVTAEIRNVMMNWRDGQQTFSLILNNTGSKVETIRAVIYAKNDDIRPPRRALSPATAYPWFDLANSADGLLTARDLERNWNVNAFGNGRSGKLVSSWPAVLQPGSSQTLPAAHNLEETSPHRVWKDQKLARVGYKEYHIWLFTPDGRCFFDQTLKLEGKNVLPASPSKPAATESPGGKDPAKPDPAKAETDAARKFKLARALADEGKLEKARERLQEIIQQYPTTKASEEARHLLEKIGK